MLMFLALKKLFVVEGGETDFLFIGKLESACFFFAYNFAGSVMMLLDNFVIVANFWFRVPNAAKLLTSPRNYEEEPLASYLEFERAGCI